MSVSHAASLVLGPPAAVKSTEEAMLDAAALDPADLTVRLVYADFMEERDGPGDGERAHFIREQINTPTDKADHHITLGKVWPKGKGDDYKNWKAWTRCSPRNCNWSLHDTEPAINVTLPRFGYDNNGTWHYEDGFLSRVACSWDHWLQFGDTLTALEPIRSVRINSFLIPEEVDGGVFGLRGRNERCVQYWEQRTDAITLLLLSLAWPRVRTWELEGSPETWRGAPYSTSVGPWKLDANGPCRWKATRN